MTIDLRTVSIEPQRQCYDHLLRRFGDKPASRYQEATYDIQAEENLHYRPTWDPEQTLYDKRVTRIAMQDWYALKDPRQFYYSTYTLARARQQDTAEANFTFVESRELAQAIPEDLRQLALALLMPLRHAAWGANLNNTLICGYGYGAALTQPCMMQALDHLGIAQYLSRLGLLLGDVDALGQGKRDWVENARWQGLRRYTEDSMAIRDPFEVFVAQNLAMDGLLYPIVYEHIVDRLLPDRGNSTIPMLTQFMTDWSRETRRWIDAVLKTAAAESDSNRNQLTEWCALWVHRAAAALIPVAQIALEETADAHVAEALDSLKSRLSKLGLSF